MTDNDLRNSIKEKLLEYVSELNEDEMDSLVEDLFEIVKGYVQDGNL